ncbi:MAG: hypothetical protein JWR83_2659 [Aeromicrobium sp.]|nr:hypothetical protein [Aeromicrobium sp.]
MTVVGTLGGADTIRLASQHLHVSLLVKGGMRVIGIGRAGCEENLLGVFPDLAWNTPWGPYKFLGGHRLWVAPERFPEVSEPEGTTVVSRLNGNGAKLSQPQPAPSGIAKTIEVELDENIPELIVRHELLNRGPRSIEVAPWGLTMFRLGGIAIVPHDPSTISGPDYTPDRNLVAWPYTSWTDPRFTLRDEALIWRASAGPRWKIGTFSPTGRIGYLQDDVLFEKRFVARPDVLHADLGCNVEIFSNEQFAELETLGPLVALGPGESVTHEERWVVRTVAGVDTRDVARLASLLGEAS